MYPVAEDTVAGWIAHVFGSCAEFEEWVKEHPKHGNIQSQGFARISGRPFAGTVDHRLDKPKQVEAQPVENMRLF